MLTPSVNIVQSSFPEELQGEISGLSRSVSNLGSSFGTAIAGTILVSDLASGNDSYVLAMVALGVLALVWALPPRSAYRPTYPTGLSSSHSPGGFRGRILGSFRLIARSLEVASGKPCSAWTRPPLRSAGPPT